MVTKSTFTFLVLVYLLLLSCNYQNADTTTVEKRDSSTRAKTDDMAVKEEAVTYDAKGTTLKGYVAYDEKSPGHDPLFW